MRKFILSAIGMIFVLNTYVGWGDEGGNFSVISSFILGIGRVEELKVYDTQGNPFYYHKKLAFPLGMSTEGSWAIGSVRNLSYGFIVGYSIFNVFHRIIDELGVTERIVGRNHLLAWQDGYWGFLLRTKIRNKAFEIRVPINEIFILASRAIVMVCDTLTGAEYYKLNYDETFVYRRIGTTFRMGGRFGEMEFYEPWFNFEIGYNYMWNSQSTLHNVKLKWKVLGATQIAKRRKLEKAKREDDPAGALYLFIETLRGTTVTYNLVGVYFSFGMQ